MRAGRWVAVTLLLALVGAGGYWFWKRRGSSHAAADGNQTANGPDARPVPVSATPVARHDVPIYLDGLGTVTAFYTVTVHSQVDGRLDQVLFREGEAVHRGQVIAQIDPRPFQIQLRQAQALLARDRANLRANEVALQRDNSLSAQHIIAPQDLDNQQSAVGQLQASTRADQAQIANAELMLDYARIVSPIDGVTGVRLVDPGNIVRASDPTGLVVITQLDPIAVFFTLPEDSLPAIARRMHETTLTVDVMSRDGTQPLGTGHLAVIDNQINQNTATIRLKAIFDNPQHLLWPNQFVKARLLLDVHHGALVIPAVAIQRGPQGTFVYVVGSDQRVSTHPVQVIDTQDDQVILAGGLNVGDLVVTDGQSRLRPGARVAVQAPDHGDGHPINVAPTRPAAGDGAPAGGAAGARHGGGHRP